MENGSTTKSFKTNGYDHADKIARIIANSVDGACIQFAKELDFYGDFSCVSCPLKGLCNDADKLEKWLKSEAESESRG